MEQKLPEDPPTPPTPPPTTTPITAAAESFSLQEWALNWELTGSSLTNFIHNNANLWTQKQQQQHKCWEAGSRDWMVNSSAHVPAGWRLELSFIWKVWVLQRQGDSLCLYFFWQELTFFLINKLNSEDCFPLQILATYFPLKIWTYWCQYLQYVSKRTFFCCFIEELSGSKESRRWIVMVEAWIFICVFMSGEVWWMSVGTGTPGWTEHKRLFSRWVPGPKDEDTHLAEILSDSKTTES